MATASLKKRRPDAKMGNSAHFPGSRNVGKKRGPIKNLDTPLGQTASFLVHRIGRLDMSVDEFADALTESGWNGSHHAVRKWLTGSNGPTLGDLRFVAKALGYESWVEMVADIGKHHRKR